METFNANPPPKRWPIVVGAIFLCIAGGFIFLLSEGSRSFVVGNTTSDSSNGTSTGSHPTAQNNPPPPPPVVLDIAAYNAKLLQIANLPAPRILPIASSTVSSATSTANSSVFATSTILKPHYLWPASTTYPNAGALLPFNRIVAYYGNLYSTQMGILGEYPSPQVLAMLASTTAEWATADPTTPVIPALDYIAVAAQASPGPDGKYRLRMPDSQVDKILSMAQQVNGLVFLDIQVGLSNVETEVPVYEKYLEMPNVELSLDPEFDMHNGERPGTVIGTMDASDINFAAQYLANLVKQYNLPPKILVVHRFTDDMVTNYKEIQPLPQVEIVMDMDGFGYPAKKINTYEQVIEDEPVQFTGFKLFYKNDAAGPDGHLMTPSEVLKLSPQPSYIQYQ